MIAITIVVIGLLSLYSTSTNIDSELNLFNKQLISALLGIAVMAIVAYLPTNFLKSGAIAFYVATILLLVAVLFFGTVVNGTKGWFRLGSMSFQPAELAKISVILLVARYLSQKGNSVTNIWDISIVTAFMLLPVILINLQPDFGTALVILVAFIGILYWGGFDAFFLFLAISCGGVMLASLKSVSAFIIIASISTILLVFFKKKIYIYIPAVLLIIGVGLASPVLYDNLAYHQKLRIDVFLNPGTDPQGAGYNVLQSVMAVGSGGITGKGFMQGTLTQLEYIPMQWTDFIFSVTAEEFGFMGSMLVIILLLSLVYQGISIASASKDRFYSTLAIGVAAIFLFHIFINVGMVIGIMPVMGIPLPFMSYGGTSLMVNLALVGLLLNANRNNILKAKS